jgi:3-(3-hydroxy-phenyl)propionate hydroxylase
MWVCPISPGDGSTKDYQVIVVGGGPTGLTTANLLGRYGIRTLLVERNTTTVQEPRAVSIDDESLRTLQACGAIESVIKQVVAGYGSEYFTPRGRLFLKVGPTGAPYGYPRRNAFRQPILEAQLRGHLKSFPEVETLFGWRVDKLTQSDAGVVLELRGPQGAAGRVRGAYVVAADGASSSVRASLGLQLEGETFAEKWLIVDLEDSPAPSQETLVFCDVRRPCIALPGPNGTRRFEFKLIPSDDPDKMTDPDVVHALLESHGAAPQSRIRRKTVYTFHARLASRWSRGRVFLAGDACHLTPPFAGQGMNSGIRDAHNLAWKLAWVVRCALPSKVLETYEQERRDHTREMINLALRMGKIMGPRHWLSGFAAQSMFLFSGPTSFGRYLRFVAVSIAK